jgi:hypothetical protein
MIAQNDKFLGQTLCSRKLQLPSCLRGTVPPPSVPPAARLGSKLSSWLCYLVPVWVQGCPLLLTHKVAPAPNQAAPIAARPTWVDGCVDLNSHKVAGRMHIQRHLHSTDHPAGDAGVVTPCGVPNHRHLLLQAQRKAQDNTPLMWQHAIDSAAAQLPPTPYTATACCRQQHH